MAQVEGLNLRGSRWYVRIVIPDDLRGAYGKARVNLALATSDRKEAVLRGTLERAKWLADFEAKRAALMPTRIEAITPDLAAHLAAMVRAHVLGNDDRVRSDVKLLAEMVHIRQELRRREANPLRISSWEPTEVREDDLSGLTPEEVCELADLNAYLDGQAAVALAGQNLKSVMPLVEAQAALLGFDFDTKTPGLRDALIACLKAFRTAHRELTMRDAGEVVETPVVVLPSSAPSTSIDKPKTLRLGFLGYVTAIRKAGHDSLWPALPLRKVRASDYFGRWFKEFREGLGMVGADQPSFHYFRHTVRPLMRRAGIDSRTRDLITGHETSGILASAHAFSDAREVLGYEVNESYLDRLRDRLSSCT